MTDMSEETPRSLDIREQIARIDQMLADHVRIQAHTDQLFADRDRRRQEIKFAPVLAMISGMTAGAAFFAAGVAFVKLLH